MAVVIQTMNKNRIDFLAATMLMVLLLGALHMMSGAVQRSEDLGQWFVPLLLFTVIGLVILVILVGWNLWQLIRDYRKKATGSRLAARFSVYFIVLALVPTSIVYFYSLQFLSRGIDSWFDVQVDSAMEDALALSRLSLDLHKRELQRLTETQIKSLDDYSRAGLDLSLHDLRIVSNAIEMTLYNSSGQTLAMSHMSDEVLVSTPLDVGVIDQVLKGVGYVGMKTLKEGPLAIQVVVSDKEQRDLILHAIYPVSERLDELSTSVQDAYTDYKERNYLRDSIKFSFGMTLSLVMALALFAAIWVGINASRRLVKPLSDIVKGTRAVAEGNYDKQLPVPHYKDELSFLVSSFNAMMRRIDRARNSAEASRTELQAQHAYLQTVLGGLSSGVMVLDYKSAIKTANPSAEEILKMPLDDWHGEPFSRIGDANEELMPFIERVVNGLNKGLVEGRAEISLQRPSGKQVLLCRHSPLRFGGEPQGHVLVFDDVTELVKAQRDAAWGEVARRLAHEIKNPLTPIQLSAERVRRRYLPKFSEEDGAILDRATKTIVQQVEAMKSMVNEFSDYAKPCQIALQPIEFDVFVAEVMALYEGRPEIATFTGSAAGAFIEADPIRLRQVLHNLVKNGLEAVQDIDEGRVSVTTYLKQDNDCSYVKIVIADTGKGFEPSLLDQVFDPYVSTKPKGTGLGLAIVKRIISEHGGNILAKNMEEGGGCVVVKLPVLANDKTPAHCAAVLNRPLESEVTE